MKAKNMPFSAFSSFHFDRVKSIPELSFYSSISKNHTTCTTKGFFNIEVTTSHKSFFSLDSMENQYRNLVIEELETMRKLILSQTTIVPIRTDDIPETTGKKKPIETKIILPSLNPIKKNLDDSGSNTDDKSEKRIGIYTRIERKKKIKKYKEKIGRWRQNHPVNRKFEGRHKVAIKKYRCNGRFAKKIKHE